MNFKRCSTAAALLMASAIPAFAQEAAAIQPIEIPADVVVPAEHILLQFTDMEGFYVVSFENAAEICGVTEAEFTMIAEDPSTGVIYCEELADVAVRQTFLDQGDIVPLADFEDSDDDDDDGNFADDAEETAEDEANDAEGDDGILDEDDNDTEEEGPDGADDSADGTDGEGENADDGMGEDDAMDGGADAGGEVDAEAGADTN